MASKQVEDDVKRAREIAEAARTHAPEVARRVTADYKDQKIKGAPDEAALRSLLLADATLLEQRSAKLLETDNALAQELGDDPPYFKTRDETRAELRNGMVALRSSLLTNCGAGAVSAAGFAGETPEEPAALARLTRTVVASLEKKPPKATARGVKFNAREASSGLGELADQLEKALNDIRREKREEQGARSARDEAWMAFDRQVAVSALLFEGLFRRAGLADLADRLVPMRRASRSSGSTQESSGEEGETPPSGGASP
jgi:hypothetical protein